MLNFGKKFRAWRDKKKYSNSCVVRKQISERNKKPHGEVNSIQHEVIKFVSDLRQVGGFLLFHPPIKLTVTILLKYC